MYVCQKKNKQKPYTMRLTATQSRSFASLYYAYYCYCYYNNIRRLAGNVTADNNKRTCCCM